MVLGLLVDLAAGTGVECCWRRPWGGHGQGRQSGIDRKFQGRVRGMLKPGTSSLVVLVVDMESTDAVAEALSRYGGTVLKSSLSLKSAQVAPPGGPS